MFELKDFSSWKTYQGAYEGSGRSEKEWICFGKEQIGLVDSKSRTVVRINCNEKKQPTHKDMVCYLLREYPSETQRMLEKFGKSLTDERIDILMDQYPVELLSLKRNLLIRNFLKSKLKMLKELGGIQ